MPRPSKFNRDEALMNVMDAIWTDGYEASSVKSLSEMLGVTRSSFYNAFGSREALLREVLSAYSAAAPASAFSAPRTAISTRQLLTETTRDMCRTQARDPQNRGCLVVNCTTELCTGTSKLARLMRTNMSAGIDQVTLLITTGIETGEFPKGTNAAQLATSYQTLLAGMSVMSKVLPNEDSLWNTAKSLLQGLDLYEGTA